jgi:hypothetical protein
MAGQERGAGAPRFYCAPSQQQTLAGLVRRTWSSRTLDLGRTRWDGLSAWPTLLRPLRTDFRRRTECDVGLRDKSLSHRQPEAGSEGDGIGIGLNRTPAAKRPCYGGCVVRKRCQGHTRALMPRAPEALLPALVQCRHSFRQIHQTIGLMNDVANVRDRRAQNAAGVRNRGK